MIFKSDKEYNEMFEQTALLLILDLLSNINPSLSSVVPSGEYQQIKEKFRRWSDQLEIISLNNVEEGKVCTARHAK